MFNVLSHDRVQQRMVEQITETPAVSLDEEIMEIPKTQTQEKIMYCLKEGPSEFLEELIIEKSDVLVPHLMEKTIEVVKLIPQERVQNRTVEQIIDMPVVVQRQVQETVEVPQLQFIDKAVDVPVVVQRQVPIVQKVQKTVEVPQAQSTNKMMNAPVIMDRQVPAIQVVHKVVEVPQTQFIDRVVDTPVVQQRQVPTVQTVQKTVEIPQIQFYDKVADAPACVQDDLEIELETSTHVTEDTPSTWTGMNLDVADPTNPVLSITNGEGSTRHVADPSCRKRKGSDIIQSPRVRAVIENA